MVFGRFAIKKHPAFSCKVSVVDPNSNSIKAVRLKHGAVFHKGALLMNNQRKPLPASLVKGRWRRSAGGIPACGRLLSFTHPVGAGHARPAALKAIAR